MMDLREAAQGAGGEARGANARFAAVSSDTRTIAEGALFVALRGERFDGHEYIAAARARGAVAAMVDRRAPSAGGDSPLPLLVVDDTRLGLGRLATYWRRKFKLPLIVVTGSNGKTTVKEMIASILAEHAGAGRSYATPGNLNNDIGLPLTLLGLRAEHSCAVVELGMNHAGETAYLAGIAQPTVALVNNAQREHQEFMQSVADVAQEHGAVFAALPEDGVAVINADDTYAEYWRGVCAPRRVLDFGIDRPAAVGGRFQLRDFGSEIELHAPEGEAPVSLQAAGVHNVRNALAAAAAATAAGVGLGAIARGLAAFEPVPGRLQKQTGKRGAIVLDDTYNANPDSVIAAIAVLARTAGAKFLVLGDMGEVGAHGAAFHAEIGRHARAAGIDRLYLLGESCTHAAAAFGEGARHYGDIDALLAELEPCLAQGVTVLIKGSRFMRMERVVQALTGAQTGGH
ncbi:MAG: UDP-N-acetylmuramoyl-tripeptide--D-alanyl-D-alanine ligase [Betaproteobacteria bacterium RIFCSPLOWO2_02_FULL_65_24]|nr:MAG: UDP-N-acetylmuramoyl-tripeptide--D-alanyl-D-alanine ligase [Betaproteobacteria bacterium RIFCSPLOWO2_02_FULL_65_24]